MRTGSGARKDLCKRVLSLAWSLCLLSGSLVLAGWIFDGERFHAGLPGVAAVKADTALSIVLLSLSVGLLQSEGGRRRRLLATACALAAASVGLLALADTAFHWNVGFAGGRMDPPPAGTIVVLGLGLLAPRRARLSALASHLPLLALILSYAGLLAYVYDAGSLARGESRTTIPILTAGALLALSIAAVLLRPDRGFARVLLSKSPGGALLRRLLLATMIAMPLLGWLRGEETSLLGARIGNALIAISIVVGVSALLTWAARALDATEDARRRTQEAAHKLAAIVESSKEAIIGESLDGTIRSWNAGAEAIYGYSADEVVGRPISILVPPHSDLTGQLSNRGLQALLQSLTTG